MDARLFFPATQRNRDPILDVLRRALPPSGAVLEVASGSGEHIVWFAKHLPALEFQPSDMEAEHRASIASWIADAKLSNVHPPVALDAIDADWRLSPTIAAALSAMLCINMIHIAPWRATLGLLDGAQRYLPPGGVLFLYGPYRRNGTHTAPSNAAFDRSLRAQNAQWGVRDLDDVLVAARARGLELTEVVEMPANNLSVVLRIS